MTAIAENPRAATLIRNEPVQARSTARLAALLDAAARVVDRIGYERLTTAMVAEGAGASIGTVYRYFPDRIAVLQSLSARNLERVGEAALAAAASASGGATAVDAVLDRLIDAFRSEPGFASLRFGDPLDLRPREGALADDGFAARLHDVLVERFGARKGADAELAVRAALATADALIARASGSGDEKALLDIARRQAHALIDPVLA